MWRDRILSLIGCGFYFVFAANGAPADAHVLHLHLRPHSVHLICDLFTYFDADSRRITRTLESETTGAVLHGWKRTHFSAARTHPDVNSNCWEKNNCFEHESFCLGQLGRYARSESELSRVALCNTTMYLSQASVVV